MKKAIKILLIVFLIFDQTHIYAWATEYYVKNGGNDADTGLDNDHAWETIAKVQATVQNGDIVYFRSQDTWSGTSTILVATAGVKYYGASYGTGTRARFLITGGGATNEQVIDLASNIEVDGIEIDGGGLNYTGMGALHSYSDVTNVLINNCQVHHTLMSGGWNYGIHIGGYNTGVDCTYWTITYTDVYDVGHEAFAVYPSNNQDYARSASHITIQHCRAWDYGIDGNTHSDGYYVTNDASDILIEDSEAFSSQTSYPAHGLDLNCKYSYTCPNNVTIRRNKFHGMNSNGMQIAGHSQEQPGVLAGAYNIYDNVAYNNDDAELYVGYYIDPAANIRIMNNTLVHTNDSEFSWAGAAVFYIISATSGTPVYMRNNIIWSDYDSCLFTRYANDTARIDHLNNHYFKYGETSGWVRLNDGGIVYTKDQVKSTWDTDCQNDDPLFVNAAGYNFHLMDNSPATNNGVSLATYFTTDYDGVSWIGGWGMGAFRFVNPTTYHRISVGGRILRVGGIELYISTQ